MCAARALAPVALLAVAGCIRSPGVELARLEGPLPAPEPMVEYQITIAPDESPPTPAQPAIAIPPIVPDPVRFQMGAGYAALARVDLADCRETGLQPGYVHVRATFTRVGYVVRASVASTAAPPPRALDCIAAQLRQTGVPAFDGSEAKLSKTYFVETGGGATP
jgi:hypothetical protein